MREIGVRLALGATSQNVIRLMMGHGAAATTVGALAGVGAALALMRFLATMLFDVTARDPTVFIAAPLALTTVALVACAVPAVRATTIDPVSILRSE